MLSGNLLTVQRLGRFPQFASALSQLQIGIGSELFFGEAVWDKEVPMQKKYIVRLTDGERRELQEIIAKLRGGSQKARRAQILTEADADGPAWTDARICEAYGCRRQTVENLRQRVVESGFREVLDGKRRAEPPTEKLLDGKQEAQLIALRLGAPPRGYAQWTLRLLARKVVELEIAETVSYETIRRTLKKTG